MHKISPALFVTVCWMLSGACFGASPSPEARLAAQNRLFEEFYQFELRVHPERATAYGDYRYNDRLDEYSLAALKSQHSSDRSFLARLEGISTNGFSEQDALSHEVLRSTLRQRLANYGFKEYEMPVNQMEGPHLRLADLPLAVPLESVKQYEDYIARLHQIPRVFAQTEEVLRAGLKDKLMPVRFLLEKIPAQCRGVVAADPFLLPTKKFPADISAADQQRLTQAITETVVNEVLPAYAAFADFIAADYAPHGRTALSVASLADGKQRYLNDIRSRTTVSNLTPAQIHEIGLKEIERIQTDMVSIARRQGFADLASFRESLKNNPQVQTHFRRRNRRCVPPLHRADAAQDAGAVYLSPRLAGHCRAHAGFSGSQCHALSNRHSRRQTSGPGRGGGIELRRSLAHRRRGHRLSRGHPRTSHAAIRGPTTGRSAQISPAFS